jgi:hypothetical protein
VKKLIQLVLAATLVVAGGVAFKSTGSAEAAGGPVPKTVYTVTKKSTNTKYTNYASLIGKCYSDRNGMTCSVSVGITVTNTIQVAFSLKNDWVAGQLGYTWAKSTTTTLSCSYTMPANRTLVVYPTGTRRVYDITESRWSPAGIQKTTKSGLSSFHSDRGIHCSVRYGKV